MKHLHVKAEPCARGFKSIIEVCNDGNRLFKLEGGKFLKTKVEAEQYAMTLGKTFLKELETEGEVQVHTS